MSDPLKNLAFEDKDKATRHDLIFHAIYGICEDADKGNMTGIMGKRGYLLVMVEEMETTITDLQRAYDGLREEYEAAVAENKRVHEDVARLRSALENIAQVADKFTANSTNVYDWRYVYALTQRALHPVRDDEQALGGGA